MRRTGIGTGLEVVDSEGLVLVILPGPKGRGMRFAFRSPPARTTRRLPPLDSNLRVSLGRPPSQVTMELRKVILRDKMKGSLGRMPDYVKLCQSLGQGRDAATQTVRRELTRIAPHRLRRVTPSPGRPLGAAALELRRALESLPVVDAAAKLAFVMRLVAGGMQRRAARHLVYREIQRWRDSRGRGRASSGNVGGNSPVPAPTGSFQQPFAGPGKK